MNDEILIFVYGTLKKGFGNNKIYLSNSQYIGDGITKGYLFTKGIPFLTDGTDDIQGEMYLIPYNDYMQVRHMELSAGYYEDIIDVKCKDKIFECITFKYPKNNLIMYNDIERITNYTKRNLRLNW